MGSKRAHRSPKTEKSGNCDPVASKTSPVAAPYSPDMAPSDFYLFRSLEHWLRGKKFKTIEEMRESLEEFFASKDRDWYRRGLTRLEEQWQKVIENNGEYFDY